MMICNVIQAGRIPYRQALDLQNQLAEARGQDSIPDQLLLLEHPHTFTLGTSGREENLLIPLDEAERRGIEIYRVDRGGDITYHGPGQLVGYPIIQLPRASQTIRADVVGYVRNIETVIILTLADYGVVGKPIRGLTGVWVDTPTGEAKVCAIGVRVNVKAVTKHGFAFNLNTDLNYFEDIIPCGIIDRGVTSLAKLLGHPVDEAEVSLQVIQHFGDVFGFRMNFS